MDATKVLRQNGFQHLIIGVTGNVLEDDLLEYYRAGADLVLTKPLKMAMLLLIIQHINHHGFHSKPGMVLVVASNRLQWQPLL